MSDNNIAEFLIELTADLPTECGSVVTWFLQFNFLYEETILEILSDQYSGETNVQVKEGIPP